MNDELENYLRRISEEVPVLMGHIQDLHARYTVALEKLTVVPTEIRMRRDLEYVMDVNGEIFNRLAELNDHVKRVLEWLPRPQEPSP